MRYIERLFRLNKQDKYDKSASEDWLKEVVDAQTASKLMARNVADAAEIERIVALKEKWMPHINMFRESVLEWERLQIDSVIVDVNKNIFKNTIRNLSCRFGKNISFYSIDGKSWSDGGIKVVNRESSVSEIAALFDKSRHDPEEVENNCVLEREIYHSEPDGYDTHGDPQYQVLHDFIVELDKGNVICNGRNLGVAQDFTNASELRIQVKDLLLKRF